MSPASLHYLVVAPLVLIFYISCKPVLAVGLSPAPLECYNLTKQQGGSERTVKHILNDTQFRDSTVQKLQHVVRIPTEIVDTTDIVDPIIEPGHQMWRPFADIHAQLKSDFPTVFSKLKVETVSEYALILTWQGQQNESQPLLISANMDVVPLSEDTKKRWKYDPYEGRVLEDKHEGMILWGLGSFDKSYLVGVLQAIEHTLASEPDFQPNRTIVVALGNDEQAGGYYGAGRIKEVLLGRYGTNGIYSVLAKSLGGIQLFQGDVLFAPLGITERQQVIFKCNLTMTGGHSSLIAHTNAFSVLSQLINRLERFPPKYLFSAENPTTNLLQCVSQHSAFLSEKEKAYFRNALTDAAASANVSAYISSQDVWMRNIYGSIPYVTKVTGGLQTNMEPEYVTFEIHNVIDVPGSVELAVEIMKANLKDALEGSSIALEVQGEPIISHGIDGYLQVGYDDVPLNRFSPVDQVWTNLGGTIKGFYETFILPERSDNRTLFVGPSISLLQSDARLYGNLTANIYYFRPGYSSPATLASVNGLDEHVTVDSLIHIVAFFYQYFHTEQ